MKPNFERKVVLDSNVIIDFKAGGIREAIFLSHFSSMNRLVYEAEMKKDRKYLAPHTRDGKFEIIERTEAIDEMLKFLRQSIKPENLKGVSRWDLLGFATALAMDRRFATGDGRLRRAASGSTVKLTGTIGLSCDLIEDGQKTLEEMLAAVDSMEKNRRRLPWKTFRSEIEKLWKKTA